MLMSMQLCGTDEVRDAIENGDPISLILTKRAHGNQEVDEIISMAEKSEILFIHKDPDRNPEDFPQPSEDDLHCAIEETFRYNEPVKHRNQFASTADFPTTPDATDLRRCGYQLLRTTSDNGVKAKRDIWSSDSLTVTSNIRKTGTGLDVDVVCMDNGSWIGHIEFINI